MIYASIIQAYLIVSFTATIIVIALGARLYRLRDERECRDDIAAERALGIGGGADLNFHNRSNTDV